MAVCPYLPLGVFLFIFISTCSLLCVFTCLDLSFFVFVFYNLLYWCLCVCLDGPSASECFLWKPRSAAVALPVESALPIESHAHTVGRV